MWADESVFYQIYPLGFCNAPFENDLQPKSRILKIVDWIEHLKNLGINAMYMGPVFESDTHGYNTRDYKKIDCRLGTEKDFRIVCEELNKNNIKIVLDGVFHHVGRGFFGFQDVLEKRNESRYQNWFFLDFSGNSHYNDGLWYEGWEGNYDLVKLNLKNPEVVDYLLECVSHWISTYHINGLRLDVAYSLDEDFLRKLHTLCKQIDSDFWIMGEMLHGDYNRLMNSEMLDSVTNYECYKGIFSSMNSYNLFEINHSLLRQFGSDRGAIYRGKHLFSFVDNHDVSRIFTILSNKMHLKPAYTILFGMPGIPCIYYGSEWGVSGDKSKGDSDLRPYFNEPEQNELTEFLKKLIQIKKSEKALNYGNFTSVLLTNRQCIFERLYEEEKIWVCVNIEEKDFYCNLPGTIQQVKELISDRIFEIHDGFLLHGFETLIFKF